MALERIAFTYNAGTFAVLKALLESEGIGVLDIARGGHVTIAGVDHGYYIEVLTEDRPLSERILREQGFGEYLVPEKQPG